MKITEVIRQRFVVYTWCDGKFDAHTPGWERGPWYANEAMAQQQVTHYERQGQPSKYEVETND